MQEILKHARAALKALDSDDSVGAPPLDQLYVDRAVQHLLAIIELCGPHSKEGKTHE